MKYIKFVYSFCLLTSPMALFCAQEGFLFNSPEAAKIHVHNRILAKVNGKPISVIDVMKKMDIVFYNEFPEYTTSTQARFQFYEANWKSILHDLINKQLVLADAEESKMEISNGDVRQEMETLFGPNIIENLDKVGLTFDEASKIIQGDLLLKRMIGTRVHSKAMRIVTPSQIREFYDGYAQEKKNVRTSEWHYQIISFRDQDALKSENSAKLAHQLLFEGKATTQNLKEILESQNGLADSTVLNISDVNKHQETQMSEANKPIILALNKGSISDPIAQKSRTDKSTVYRIFILTDKIEGGTIPFTVIENKIRDKLLDDAVNEETEAYIKRLKVHYHYEDKDITEQIPETFKPFTMK